jgi:hypothetical protein
MSATKSALIAGGAAVIAEAILWWCFSSFGHIGADGPDTVGAIGLIFHLAGATIADVLHLTGTMDSVFIAITGALQFFLVFWLPITIWRHKHAKRIA